MKKIFYILFFILLGKECFAQSTFSAVVKDFDTGSPILGVHVYKNDSLCCTTDQYGKFSINAVKDQDTISFSHIAYEKKYKIFSTAHQFEPDIFLQERDFSLEEVVIYPEKAEKLRRYIRSLSKKYRKEMMPDFCYWAKVHINNVSLKENKVQHYFESLGHMFMINNNEKDPFSEAIYIPQAIRMSEPPLVKNRKTAILRVPFYKNSFVDYRFFSVLHPLNGNTKRFSFKKEDRFIGDKRYEVIKYTQTSRLKKAGWFLRQFNGELWVDAENNTLVKEYVNFYFENFYSTNFIISYQLKDGNVYPSNITYNTFFYKDRENSDQQSCTISFLDINTKPRKNYFNKYGHYFIINPLEYDAKLWKDYPLENSVYYKEFKEFTKGKTATSVFKKGAKSILFDEKHPTFKSHVKPVVIPINKLWEEIMNEDFNGK